MGESRLASYDAAGKFNAVIEEAYQACRKRHGRMYDLTAYSLTLQGETEPSRLIVKMTLSGNGDGYLSAGRLDVKEAGVAMISLDYQAFPADQMVMLCKSLTALFLQTDPGEAHVHLLKYENTKSRAAVADFFSVDPREGEPGAEIYLRDKAFFTSVLPDSEKPDFPALPLLTDEQKASVTFIDMSRADIRGRWSLHGLFRGYKSLRELDLSALDTARVGYMGEMFCGCESLRRLDLSAFDFTHVESMEGMFGACHSLEEVILSDTIYQAGRIPHRRTRRHTTEELNKIYRDEYIMRGPELAGRAADAAESEIGYVCYGAATEEEQRRYLGLPGGKITIVPHRARR